MEQLLSALRWIERQTHTRTNYPQMLVGLQEGLYLRDFVRKTKSLRILEIGTFTGYSLACLAGGVLSMLEESDRKPENTGRSNEIYVDAIEINRELDYIISEGLERAGVSGLVKIFFSDAVDLLSSAPKRQEAGIAEEYDLVFIDADKRQYPQYYALVLPLVKPGGYILADNVEWYGQATGGAQAFFDKKSQTTGIMSFNRLVESDGRVESQMLDLRDGLYIIRKK